VFAHSGKHGETLAGNNVFATMFPSLPRALVTARIETQRYEKHAAVDNFLSLTKLG
jgi:hypothetical protein